MTEPKHKTKEVSATRLWAFEVGIQRRCQTPYPTILRKLPAFVKKDQWLHWKIGVL